MLDEITVLTEDKENTFTMMPSRTRALTTSGTTDRRVWGSGLPGRRTGGSTETKYGTSCTTVSYEPATTSEPCPDLSTDGFWRPAFRFRGRP